MEEPIFDFKVLDDWYQSQVLFFIKSNDSNYNDEIILKQLGVNRITKLISNEAILNDELWPKVCMLNDNDWICVLDELYGLYGIQWDENPDRKLLLQKLSQTIGDVMIIGLFSEVSDAFIFEYFKNGQQIRDIDCETVDFKQMIFNIKETGDGERLKELPEILDFDKRPTYIKTVLANFGITLPEDISDGRFYAIKY